MEQMTTEELIEYFIEQLGDNEILGKVMSIEQIRQKLINIVENVTYNSEPGNLAGECIINQNGRVTINFDTRKIFNLGKNVTIVHELLHALSTRSKPIDSFFGYQEIHEENCGLHLIQTHYFPEGEKMSMGRNCAINEGMTDTLAESITGDFHNGYNTEKDIYRIVSIIVGEDNMLQKYFSKQVFEEKTLNVFEEDIIKKYGADLGNNLNDDLKKVFSLSDQLLDLDRTDVIYRLNSNGKEIQSKTKDEIYNTLENMIYLIIEHEPDAMMRIQEILEPGFNTRLREKIADKVLGDLIKSDEFDFKTKIAFLDFVSQAKNSIIPKKVVDSILFESHEANNMSAKDKLKYFLKFDKTRYSFRKDERPYDKLYDLYVQSEKISEDRFSKRNIFKDCVDIKGSANEIDLIMNKITYRQIGEYYELCGDYAPASGKVYNAQGEHVESEYIRYSGLKDDDLDRLFFDNDGKEKVNELHKQIDSIFKDLEKDCENAEDYKKRIVARGNMLKIEYEPILEELGSKKYKYYYINSDGTLEEIEARSRA